MIKVLLALAGLALIASGARTAARQRPVRGSTTGADGGEADDAMTPIGRDDARRRLDRRVGR